QGIGLACAEVLAEDGHLVVLSDIQADAVEAAAARIGGGARAYSCDVGQPDQILALFERIEAELGPVEVLVNNAGIARPADFLEVSIEDFNRVIGVNLTGTFVATQRAARTMVARGIAGSIVNMSS